MNNVKELTTAEKEMLELLEELCACQSCEDCCLCDEDTYICEYEVFLKEIGRHL